MKNDISNNNINIVSPQYVLYMDDCISKLNDIEDESIDLILTDPPYNISVENDARNKTKLNSPIMRREKTLNYDFGEWDNMERQDFLDFTKDWFVKCINKLRNGGTIISFFNKEDISYLVELGKANNCRERTIFTWHKTNPVPSFRKVNYLSSTEFAFIGVKGDKAWTFNFLMQKEMHNFYETANKSSYGETEHPTEKPVVLMEHFIKIHTNENDTILDCFMGSGTTGVAAINLNRKFIGIEKDEKFFNIAKGRIEKSYSEACLAKASILKKIKKHNKLTFIN